MIWAGVALAGQLTLVGPGKIERPADRLDFDAAFERPDDKTVEGVGWFRIRSLGVPYFVHLDEDTRATVDLRERTVDGSETVRWQLEGQWEADTLHPADLKQLKKAVKKLEKTLKSAPRRARELGRGRLLMVVAERQKPEIGAWEDWLARAAEAGSWTEATVATPTFVDFGLEVGRGLSTRQELEVAAERVSSSGVPGERTLLYGLMAASIECCVDGRTEAGAVRDRVSAWPELYGRLDALLPAQGGTPPPVVGKAYDDTSGRLALAEQGNVLLGFWDATGEVPAAIQRLAEHGRQRSEVQVVLVASGEDETSWRAKVRELEGDGVIQVLSSEAHDRWYVEPEGLAFFAVQDGQLAGGALSDVQPLLVAEPAVSGPP